MSRKSFSERFLNYKSVKSVLIRDDVSSYERAVIDEFFAIHDFRSEQDNFKRYATWLQQGKVNWEELNLELKKHERMSIEYFMILYGQSEGKCRWDRHVNHITKNLSTNVDYWLTRGYNIEDANSKISEIQKRRSQKSAQFRNSRQSSIWCKEYWLSRGYSEDESVTMVSLSQRRDLSYYTEKYGDDEGELRFTMSKNRRKATWVEKSNDELAIHAEKTRPKTYNENGQEIQAIRMFIEQNGIDIESATVMYGAPRDQFYQWIPDVGFRRYDLAILGDNGEPNIIFEYHGPGHINFSEYSDSMYDETIVIGGKKLDFLGTYGKVYYNDLYKKNHIEDNFPNANLLCCLE